MISNAFCIETGNYIPVSLVDKNIHKNFLCPLGHPLMAKKGTQMVHHYSHFPNTICTIHNSHNNKTDWHKRWQSLFTNTEIYIEGKRADIVTNRDSLKSVIEVQYSPISKEEIEKREQTYPNLTWIFHVSYENGETEFIGSFKNLITDSREEKGDFCIIKVKNKWLKNAGIYKKNGINVFYDCGKYLLKKKYRIKNYLICQIVSYEDFLTLYNGNNEQLSILLTNPFFDFSFHLHLPLKYKESSIYFTFPLGKFQDTDIYYPFVPSKNILNSYVLL